MQTNSGPIEKPIGLRKGVYIGETLSLRGQRKLERARYQNYKKLMREAETARYNGKTTTAKGDPHELCM